jgi:hypothetical protein
MRSENEVSRVLSIASGLALLVGLIACGGSDIVVPPPPTPVPTPTPPVVLDSGGGAIEAGFIAMAHPIVTTAAGALEVTVDWTFAKNDIDVVLARGACSFEQLEAKQCTIAAVADSETAKPERVRTSGAAGTYTLFVENIGPDDDSASYQAVFFAGASSASEASIRSRSGKVRRSWGRVTW